MKMGDQYVALYDCFFAGRRLRSGDTVTVPPGTVVTYPWLEKVVDLGIKKPMAKKKKMSEEDIAAEIQDRLSK